MPEGSAIAGGTLGLAAALTHGAVAPDATRTVDGVRPVLSSVKFDGTVLDLAFSEALDAESVPAPSDFAVEMDGNAVTLAGDDPVVVSGSTVTLAPATAERSGGTVTVSYVPPAGANAGPIQDMAGNDAGAIEHQRMTGFSDGALRLVNGNVAHEGRLEISHGGRWGTICDDYWTDEEADVACRALGYESGSVGNGGCFHGGGRGLGGRSASPTRAPVRRSGDSARRQPMRSERCPISDSITPSTSTT